MSAPISVMIFEDDPLDAKLMLRQLQQHPFQIEDHWVVDSVDEFRRRLSESSVDIILADYALPNSTALEALKVVREEGHAIPFIVVSGKVGEETAVEAMRLGATDYVMKNRLSKLGASVERALLEKKAIWERDEARSQLEMERSLRESQAQFKRLLDCIRDVYWLIDLKTGEPVFVSPSFETVWRMPVTELSERGGWSWVEKVHPDDRSSVEHAARLAHEGASYDLDFRIELDDPCETRSIHARGFPIPDDSGQLHRYAGVMEDITDEKETRNAASQLRQTIGSELHDSVSQELVGAFMIANSLAETLQKQNVPEFQNVKTIAEGIDCSLQIIRRLIRGLVPVELDADGVEAALVSACQTAHERFGVECDLHCPMNVPISSNEVATNLFLIAQEAISNAARHASASLINVSLTRIDGETVLKVDDDGHGFQEVPSNPGRGLRSMRYRARTIGAAIEIKSTTEGTSVTSTVHK